jgi:Tetratricopeptide repeat
MEEHMRISRLSFLLASVLATSIALAQLPASSNPEADAAFQRQDWAKAVVAYQKMLERDPNDGNAWYRLAFALASSEQPAQSIKAFENALRLNFLPMNATYNLAALNARVGQKEVAFDYLNKVLEIGFYQAKQFEQDTDFDSIRQDPRFAKVVARAKENFTPCQGDANFRQFDFWVGEWDVTSPNGTLVGRSKIEPITSGCALLEHWNGVNGGTGKSLSAYNGRTKKWQQFWVNASGEIHEYSGSLVGNEMRIEGPGTFRNGRQDMKRMTLTKLDDGRVRQKGEVSQDGGKTFAPQYDFIYTRRK